MYEHWNSLMPEAFNHIEYEQLQPLLVELGMAD